MTIAGTRRRASGAIKGAGASATTLVAHAPGAVRSAGVGVRSATTALQELPDARLRWLAASSVGLSIGFLLAGAPRLFIAAGAAPALLMGAAILGRPVDQAAGRPRATAAAR
jgi:hypothetical protein